MPSTVSTPYFRSVVSAPSVHIAFTPLIFQLPVFDAIQLADIARQLDREEGRRLEDGGTAAEIDAWNKQPSNNMDDSGFFSVQV